MNDLEQELSNQNTVVVPDEGYLGLFTNSVGSYFRKFGGESCYRFIPTPDALDIFWSCIAAFLGIAFLGLIDQYGLAPYNHIGIAPSFGALAVLIYAVEGSFLAQPYNVLCGNVIGCIVGIIMNLIFYDTGLTWLAGALAVSTTTQLQIIFRCQHPPGGACSLWTSTVQPAICQGWWTVLMPVILGVVVMCLTSMVVLNAKASKSYPKYWLPVNPSTPSTWFKWY
jgi:CBS-domain-containing membrane protein